MQTKKSMKSIYQLKQMRAKEKNKEYEKIQKHKETNAKGIKTQTKRNDKIKRRFQSQIVEEKHFRSLMIQEQ